MPSVSPRALATPSSPIRKLAEYALAAASRGIEVFNLNIGQPDVPSPDSFWKAIRSVDLKTLEYTHSAGIPQLREAAVESYRDYGVAVTTEQLIVTTGASEATLFAFLTLFQPGDEVIVPEPFYANYTTFAIMAGVRLVPLTTRIEDMFALPPTAAFEAVITERTKGVLVCNPSNPTGSSFSREQLSTLGRLAIEHDLFLLVDEVYRDFYYDGEPPTSVLTLAGLDRHAVVLDSVSKKLSLCGARIGLLVSRNEDVMANVLKYAQARLCSPALEQIGAAAALRETPAQYFQDIKDEYRARRDIVTTAISKIAGAKCPTIGGAFYATVRLPIDDCDKFCRWLLTDFEFKGRTVLLSPAAGFYLTPGLGRDEVRIAYVLNRERLAAAMECLDRALEAYPARLVRAQ